MMQRKKVIQKKTSTQIFDKVFLIDTTWKETYSKYPDNKIPLLRTAAAIIKKKDAITSLSIDIEIEISDAAYSAHNMPANDKAAYRPSE